MKITNRVLTAANQGLTNKKKANARGNIGAQVAIDAPEGSGVTLEDVKDTDGNVVKQNISVTLANDGKLTINYPGEDGSDQKVEFTANSAEDKEITIGCKANDGILTINYPGPDGTDQKVEFTANSADDKEITIGCKANDGILTINHLDTDGNPAVDTFTANASEDKTITIGGKVYTSGTDISISGNDVISVNTTGTAGGQYAFVAGDGTIANADSQVAMGKFNIADSEAMLIVGSGTDGDSRKNALRLMPNGDLYLGTNDASAAHANSANAISIVCGANIANHANSLIVGSNNTSLSGSDGPSVSIGTNNSTGDYTLSYGDGNTVNGKYPYGIMAGYGNTIRNDRQYIKYSLDSGLKILPAHESSDIYSISIPNIYDIDFAYSLNAELSPNMADSLESSEDYIISKMYGTPGYYLYRIDFRYDSSSEQQILLQCTYKDGTPSTICTTGTSYETGIYMYTMTTVVYSSSEPNVEDIKVKAWIVTDADVVSSKDELLDCDNGLYVSYDEGLLYHRITNPSISTYVEYEEKIPYYKTFGLLIGQGNSSYTHNGFALGTSNCLGLSDETYYTNENANTSNDGFTVAIGFGSTSVRNYDMAFGYHSTANGGENFAVHNSYIYGYNNFAVNKSNVYGAVSTTALSGSVLNLNYNLPNPWEHRSCNLPSNNFLYHSYLVGNTSYTPSTYESYNPANNLLWDAYVNVNNTTTSCSPASISRTTVREFDLKISQLESKTMFIDQCDFSMYSGSGTGSSLNNCLNVAGCNISYSRIFGIGTNNSSQPTSLTGSNLRSTDIIHNDKTIEWNYVNVSNSLFYFNSTLKCSYLSSSTSMPTVANNILANYSAVSLQSGATITDNILFSTTIDTITNPTISGKTTTSAMNFVFGGYHLSPNSCFIFNDNSSGSRSDPAAVSSTSDGFAYNGYNTICCEKSVVLFDNVAQHAEVSLIFGQKNKSIYASHMLMFGIGNTYYDKSTYPSGANCGNIILFGDTNSVQQQVFHGIIYGAHNNISKSSNLLLSGTNNSFTHLYNSIVLGNSNSAVDNDSTYIANAFINGNECSVANGCSIDASIIFGEQEKIVGDTRHSIVFGTEHTVAGTSHVVAGSRNTVYDRIVYSLVFGLENTVYSTMMTTALDLVVGNNNTVSTGSNMVCIGNGITATGHNSIAIGLQLQSNGFQTVIGKYNQSISGPNRYDTNETTGSGRTVIDPNPEGTALLIVGNGYANYDHYNTSSSSYIANDWRDEEYIHRSNAMVVYANGQVAASDFAIVDSTGARKSIKHSVIAGRAVSTEVTVESSETAQAFTTFTTYSDISGLTYDSGTLVASEDPTAALDVHYRVTLVFPDYLTDNRVLNAVLMIPPEKGDTVCYASQIVDLTKPFATVEMSDLLVNGTGNGIIPMIKLVEPTESDPINAAAVTSVSFKATAVITLKG